jgi:hypothetical protein
MSNITTIMVREGMTEHKEKQDDYDSGIDSGGRKTITISAKTHRELDSTGKRRETFDDIISKCIEAYKREQQKAGGGRKAQ